MSRKIFYHQLDFLKFKLQSYVKNKVIIFGLDGATFDFILPWVKQNKLPFFKRLLEESAYGYLRTTIPPLTPCAWTSFMTGKNPGKHGIVDFLWIDHNYNEKVSFNKSKTLWRILSENGLKVIVCNIPCTYPPEPVNGILISGFLTPSLKSNFTYPLNFKERLLKEFPHYFFREKVKYYENEKEREEFAEEVFKLTELHYEVAKFLLKNFDYDFFIINFMGIDHMQHWFWRFCDKNHPNFSEKLSKKHGDKIFKIYKYIDDILSDLLNIIPDNSYIILMSDHGAGPCYGTMCLNYLMLKKEFLKLKKLPNVRRKEFMLKIGFSPFYLSRLAFHIKKIKDAVAVKDVEGRKEITQKYGITLKDIDWENTLAIAFGYYNQIYVNKKGRFKNGKVEDKDYEKVREDIISILKSLNLKIKVWRKEEIYKGEFLPLLPDIFFSAEDFAYTGSSFLIPSFKLFIPSLTFKSGEHRLFGIFAITGPNIKHQKLENISIIDIAPTVLEIFKIKHKYQMDGRVLEEIFAI